LDAIAGSTRAHLANMVTGVTKGYEKKLELVGVGYRADENGRPFDGAHDYAITFAADALPPVAAFWSITVYDAAGHLYANDLHRYGLGSRQVPR